MNPRRAFTGFALSFIFLFLFGYIISFAQWFLKNPQLGGASILEAAENYSGASQNAQPPIKETIILKPEINAESAISVNSNLADADIDKVVFEKNSDVKLPIASLTKLMTAVVAIDNYNLSDFTSVSRQADLQDSANQDVRLGSKLSVESFLKIMLIQSSNKSAFALSEIMGRQKFVNAMNKKAQDLGLNNTFFEDSTGLGSKNISTAKDLSMLAKYILKNYPKIAQISSAKELDVPNFGKIINTDQLLGEISGVVFSKTGFTSEANGCLLLATKNSNTGNYFINIILGADDRFSEMRKLVNWLSAINN